MKNQKGFIPVIIILIVLLGFVGVYYLGTLKSKPANVNPSSSPLAVDTQSAIPAVPTIKPVTDPTLNWKTYTNNEFSFRYSDDWAVYTPEVEGNALRMYLGPQSVINEIKSLFSRGDGFGGGKFLTFTISEVENMPDYQSDEFQTVMRSNAQISNVKSDRYITDVIQDMQGFSKGDKIETIVVSTNGKYLVISLLDYQYKKIFDQILSTFKFTK